MPEFIPGLLLNELYFNEVVRLILDSQFPGLQYSAGLVGFGSDVIGVDTPTSRDHLWGPRLILFLRPDGFEQQAEAINQALRHNLPYQFLGYSTHYSKPDLADGGTRVSEYIDHGPVEHLIFFQTIEQFWQQELQISPFVVPEPVDWLTFQEHRLLTLTAGKIYHDGLHIEQYRRQFSYYPRDVWLYLLASQWALISQEEAFVGRTHQVDDELGSIVIAARTVERLIHLCFLMERKYAPYSKWLGTTFKRLKCYPAMGPIFENILRASDYQEREEWLVKAYVLIAEMYNQLGLTPPIEARTRTYSGWHALRGGIDNLGVGDPRNTRPHQVLFGGRFCDALLKQITDPSVRSLLNVTGSVNQFLVESSDAAQNVSFCRGLKKNLIDQ